ncbi:MAG TPA: amino acid ABC transporter permease [Casimicrobiaceae bacterium]|nr:amino acid ABC transporter permease [Casimicrobiaceae bacterium]
MLSRNDLAEYLPLLAKGALVTVEVFVCALVVATLLGLVWALMRVSRMRALSGFSKVLINAVRGIPILVQLFYIYFVFPEIGIQLSAFEAGVIGLGFAYSCYMAEVFRAGIEAVDPGQVEAAQSLGMGRALILWRVVLPQAFKISLPPYGNTCIMLLKDTSQTSIITVAELSFQGRLIASSTFKNTEIFTLVAVWYLAMCVPLILLVGRLEKKFGRK